MDPVPRTFPFAEVLAAVTCAPPLYALGCFDRQAYEATMRLAKAQAMAAHGDLVTLMPALEAYAERLAMLPVLGACSRALARLRLQAAVRPNEASQRGTRYRCHAAGLPVCPGARTSHTPPLNPWTRPLPP
jgi:hypothetical protein